MLYELKYEEPEKTITLGQMARRIGVSRPSLSRFLKETFPKKYGKEFEEWIETTKRAKFFYRWKDGELETPFETVKQVYLRVKLGRLSLRQFKNYLRMASEFYYYSGNKPPEDWETDEMVNFIYQKPEGSRFTYSVALRQFLPDKNKLPTFKKTEARIIPEIASEDFPQKFKQLIEWAMALAKNEKEREDIQLILMVKAFAGIRTGNRGKRTELWGTKYSDETDRNKSWIRIIDGKIYWNVYAKKGEIWVIKTDTIPPALDRLLRVRLQKLNKGDWLVSITSRRAIELLKMACEKVGLPKLTLHDMRKVYASFLVRSGIPLEVAVTLNVGWKDINTAYNHYVMLGGGILEKYRPQINTFFSYAGV